MSSRLVTKIQDIKGMSGKHKRVLQAWAAFANNDGTNIFAAKESVADKAGISRSTIYHNTEDLMKVGILVQAEKHTCKIATCNKGGTHFTGRWGRYTVAYDINVSALENNQTLLLLKQLKVGVSKRIKVGVQKQLKEGVSKLDATLSLGDSGQEPTHSATHVAVGSEQASQVAACGGSSPRSSASPASEGQEVCEHGCSPTIGCPLCWDDTSVLPANISKPTPQSAAPLPCNHCLNVLRLPGCQCEEKREAFFLHEAKLLAEACFPLDADERNATRIPDAVRCLKAYAKQCPDMKCDHNSLFHVWKFNQEHKTGKLLLRTMRQFAVACESPEENNLIQQSWDHFKNGHCYTCDRRVWEAHRAETKNEAMCVCGVCERVAAHHETGYTAAGYKRDVVGRHR